MTGSLLGYLKPFHYLRTFRRLGSVLHQLRGATDLLFLYSNRPTGVLDHDPALLYNFFPV